MHHCGAQVPDLHRMGADQPVGALARYIDRDRLERRSEKEAFMQQNRLFEELSGKVSALLAQSPAKDVEKNLRALLGSFFSRVDLVTREEFDVQTKLLTRSREQIDALESRVAELEAKAAEPNS
jgi:hypothetical protein